jgi:hypothetical protein
MVSETMARQEWGSPGAAVGKHIGVMPGKWNEVIGVIEDVRHNGLDHPAPAIVYWGAMNQNPFTPQPTVDVTRSATFAIHSANAGTEGFLREVQQAVWSVNGNLPVASPETMQEIYDASMARTSFTLVMLAIAGSMALLLGIVGIYGVIAYAVAQRRREIGIRLALGAQRSKLRWMFVRSALALTGVGVLVVRHQPSRSADLCCGGCGARRRCDGGQLSAGTTRGCRESGRSAARRVRDRPGLLWRQWDTPYPRMLVRDGC